MFEILRANKIDKGSLQFTLDICVPKWGDFCIHGLQVFAKDGRRWVTFPSKKIEAGNGEIRYLPFNRFKDRARQDAFAAKVIESFELWLSQGNKPIEFEPKLEPNVIPQNKHVTPAYGPGSNGSYSDQDEVNTLLGTQKFEDPPF
jgi:hypothetical protein